jgi:hypothetical protein
MVGMLNYSLGIIPKKIGYNAGISYTELSDMSNFAYQSYGLNGGVQKTLYKDKLNLSLNGGVFLITQENRNSRNLNASFSASYNATQKLRLDVLLMYNNAPTVAVLSGGYFSDFRSNVGLYYNF